MNHDWILIANHAHGCLFRCSRCDANIGSRDPDGPFDIDYRRFVGEDYDPYGHHNYGEYLLSPNCNEELVRSILES